MDTDIKKGERSIISSRKRDDFLNPLSVVDRFFGDSPVSMFDSLVPSLFRGSGLGGVSGMVFPKVDIEEMDREIRVVANVPGVDPHTLNVEVGDDYLSISGKVEKESKSDGAKGRVYRYEREFGEFRREFSLPARVEKEGIVAKSKDGVLTITLPKSKDEIKKKVKVEVH
jgi:HSP20 family protein